MLKFSAQKTLSMLKFGWSICLFVLKNNTENLNRSGPTFLVAAHITLRV